MHFAFFLFTFDFSLCFRLDYVYVYVHFTFTFSLFLSAVTAFVSAVLHLRCVTAVTVQFILDSPYRWIFLCSPFCILISACFSTCFPAPTTLRFLLCLQTFHSLGGFLCLGRLLGTGILFLEFLPPANCWNVLLGLPLYAFCGLYAAPPAVLGLHCLHCLEFSFLGFTMPAHLLGADFILDFCLHGQFWVDLSGLTT